MDTVRVRKGKYLFIDLAETDEGLCLGFSFVH